jgi:type II secretory pathway component PulJ
MENTPSINSIVMRPFRHRFTKRLTGFTLLETILALSLSAAIVSTGGRIWQILGQVHGHYQAGQQQEYQRVRLQIFLEKDGRQAQYISLFPKAGWALLDRKRDTLAQYRYQDPWLIRLAAKQRDSFSFQGRLQYLPQMQGILLEDTVRQLDYQHLLWPKARAIPLATNQE